MYGGLFGDLPAAKNANKKEKDDKAQESSSNQQQDDAGSSKQEDGRSTTEGKPSTDEKQARKKTGPSVLSGLGFAGTSMAFVPTAARQRKKQPRTLAAPPPPASQPPQRLAPSTVGPKKTAEILEPQEGLKARSGLAVASTFSDVPSRGVEETKEQDTAPKNQLSSFTSIHPSSAVSSEDQQKSDAVKQLYEEPEALRLLHEKAAEDPYDPMFPNDLLQYWEYRAFEKERVRLEEERRETLEQQERLRVQLKREREELARSGDTEGLTQHENRMGGRGRGRGVSNLPAWLVEKRKAALDGGVVGSGNDSKKPKT